MSDTPQDPNLAQEPVATGSRREDVHYEADADQKLVVRATEQVDGLMPPEEQSAAVDQDRLREEPYIGDARVTPDSPSVWDARPPAEDEDHERSGEPTGH